MIHFQCTRPVSSLGLSLLFSATLALSACGTEEIAPRQVAIDNTDTDPGQGSLLIIFSPTDATFAQEQARLMTNPNLTEYHVFIDGQQVVFDNGGAPSPMVMLEGNAAPAGNVSAGIHHFELAASGAAPIFAGDGPIVAGANNRLYLFGASGALQSRFVSYALTPPAGTEHVSVINLVRAGASVEAVSCTGAGNCTTVSPPLALGDTFDADFPIIASDNQRSSIASSGAGLGYRLVPSASLPNPPVLPMWLADPIVQGSTYTPNPPLNFIAAPIYLSPDGNLLANWN